MINTEFNICHNDWYNKGIRNIIDLVNEEGMFYNFNELKNKYNIRGPFLDLHRLISHLPNPWKNKIQENVEAIKYIKYNVHCNSYVKLLIKDKKGSRVIYMIY